MPHRVRIPTLVPSPKPFSTLLASIPTLEVLGRWEGGVTVEPTATGGLVAWSGACEDGATEKSTNLAICESASFVPFFLPAEATCSTLSDPVDFLRSTLVVALEQQTSSLLAVELMTGGLTGNPSLAGEATVVGLAAGDVVAMLGALEDAIAVDLGAAQGVIHVSGGVLSTLSAALVIERVDGRWFTARGNEVVTDPGYGAYGWTPGADPQPASAPVMYGSGPVAYRVADVSAVDIPTLDRTHNDLTVRAERLGIVVFSPCTVWVVETPVL